MKIKILVVVFFLIFIFAGAKNAKAALPNGSDCTKDSDCTSGYCEPDPVNPTCQSKLGPGGSCSANSNCQSDCCDYGFCAAATVCGGGGEGSACNNNSDCQSDCCDNGFCAVATVCGGPGGTSCFSKGGSYCATPCNQGDTRISGGPFTECGSKNCCKSGGGGGGGGGGTGSSWIYLPTTEETGLPDPQGGIGGILRNVMLWLLGIVAVIAIIAFSIAGFQYITAYGNEDQAETAKRNMTYAAIGIVVALSGLIVLNTLSAVLK